MTSGRPYRHAMSHEDALRELRQCSGTQFDPKVVEAFTQLYERQEDNKLVRAREAA
jgi:HD-GYP domain-containing protein (c-di-GMP phosphodiesterase class II)